MRCRHKSLDLQTQPEAAHALASQVTKFKVKAIGATEDLDVAPTRACP